MDTKKISGQESKKSLIEQIIDEALLDVHNTY
jgi:hypothetical protein